MKVNLEKLIEQANEDWEANDVRVKTKVFVSEIKPSTAKKLELLAIEFKKYRVGLQ
jgi:hypothetical protein